MKKSVLLFQPEPTRNRGLADAFVSAGFRVSRKNDLSGMHTLLSSRHFDAVVIDEAILARYAFVPSRHLWEYRSPLSIVVYSLSGNTCTTVVHNIPQEASGVRDKTEKNGILAEIESVIRGALFPDAPKPDDGERKTAPCAMPVFEVPLQNKLALVLSSLVRSGAAGAEIGEIARSLWGTAVPDRKKDIQIYITRLRRILETTWPDRYRIRLADSRYFLVEVSAP